MDLLREYGKILKDAKRPFIEGFSTKDDWIIYKFNDNSTAWARFYQTGIHRGCSIFFLVKEVTE